MVDIVNIEDTVRRTVSPQVGMSPNMAASSDAFGGQVGRAMQGLGAEISQAANFFIAEQRQRQDFETSTRYIEQQSANATLLDEAARGAEGTPAKDFTKTYMTEVRKRNEAFLATVPESERPKWKAKLAAAEAQLSQQALTTEFQTYDKFQTTKLAEAEDGFKQGIDQNPQAVQTYIKNGEALIDQTNWSDGVKAEKKRKWREDATKAYAIARIRQDPRAAAADLGSPEYRTGPRNQRQAYAMKKIMAAGYTKEQAAGLVGNMIQESGGDLRTTARNKGDGRDGSDSIGILQWNADRAQRLKAYAASKGKSWDDYDTQLEFIIIELNTTEKAAGDKLRAAKTVEEAAGAAATAYIRPQGSNYGATASHGWENRRNNALRLAGVDVGDVPVDPNLAALSYKDRLVLRDAAAQEVGQRDRAQAAADTAAYNERYNQFLTDIYDGKSGRDGLAAARQDGWLKDIGDIARAESMLAAREKANADTTYFTNKLATGGAVWNSSDKADRDAVEAGVKQLGGTPQAAFDVWQKTGILADSGAAALHGALISNDPKRVMDAATIARNMLTKNDNAFTGVKNGDAMETAGAVYKDLIDSGLTAEEATKRVMAALQPEALRERNVTMTLAKDLTAQELKDDPLPRILAEFNPPGWEGDPAPPVTMELKAALKQDYETAYFSALLKTGGDTEASRSLAHLELKKFWGVSRGVMTKYPPEKAYRSSGDPENPHGYIYTQAALEVIKATGHTVTENDVFPVPLLGGQTAEAFRQGKQPAYRLMYFYTDPASGQKLLNELPMPPNKGWAPDEKAAIAAASEERMKKLAEENAVSQYKAWQEEKGQRDLILQQQQQMLDQDRQNQIMTYGDYDPRRAPQMTPPPDLPPEPPMPPSLATPPAAVDDMTGIPAPGFTEPFGIIP